MTLLHQDAERYEELCSREETIRRVNVSFKLRDINFSDQAVTPGSNRDYHYRSDCPCSKNLGVWYNDDPKNLIDDKVRNELASKVAREYILVMHDGPKILNLDMKESAVKFCKRGNFSLDLTASVQFDQNVPSDKKTER